MSSVHHQESQHCIHSNRYMPYRLCWLLASGIRIIATRGGHCDYSRRSPDKTSYAIEDNILYVYVSLPIDSLHSGLGELHISAPCNKKTWNYNREFLICVTFPPKEWYAIPEPRNLLIISLSTLRKSLPNAKVSPYSLSQSKSQSKSHDSSAYASLAAISLFQTRLLMTHATTVRPRSWGMREGGTTPDRLTTTTLHGAYCSQPTHSVCCNTTHPISIHRAVFHPSISPMYRFYVYWCYCFCYIY
jgi:hypothetical protein